MLHRREHVSTDQAVALHAVTRARTRTCPIGVLGFCAGANRGLAIQAHNRDLPRFRALAFEIAIFSQKVFQHFLGSLAFCEQRQPTRAIVGIGLKLRYQRSDTRLGVRHAGANCQIVGLDRNAAGTRLCVARDDGIGRLDRRSPQDEQQ